MSAEFWVMRIVMRSPRFWALAPLQVKRDVASGALAVVAGEICEPIDCYADQEKAIVAMEARAKSTGQPHKVVLNADVADLVTAPASSPASS